MAHEVYVNCEGQEPLRAVEAVRRDVGSLRPGASTVVALLRDVISAEAVEDWARRSGLHSVRQHRGRHVMVRLYVLPTEFGELAECTRRELCRVSGQPYVEPLTAGDVLVALAS